MEKTGPKIKQAVLAGCLSFTVAYIMAHLLLILGLLAPNPGETIEITPLLFWENMIGGIIVAPVMEEFIYRWIPIRIAQWLGVHLSTLWTVIIISSIYFGLIHGAWQNIFIQGIAGLIFAIIFLRHGYRYSVLTHATHNFLSLLPLAILYFKL